MLFNQLLIRPGIGPTALRPTTVPRSLAPVEALGQECAACPAEAPAYLPQGTSRTAS